MSTWRTRLGCVGWPRSSPRPGLPSISTPLGELVIDEIDYALRPHVHERRVPSYGSIVEPTTAADAWEQGRADDHAPADEACRSTGTRLFADGLSSWLVRRLDGDDEWAVFDRPAGPSATSWCWPRRSARRSCSATRPAWSASSASSACSAGTASAWHHEPPIGDLDRRRRACSRARRPRRAREAARVRRPRPRRPGHRRHPRLPPRRRARRRRRAAPAAPAAARPAPPTDLAPLRHALAQVDGAAVFDGDGMLRQLGVRLVPSPEAESTVDGLRGMRHTVGPALQLRRPGGHRDRRQRGRPGHRAPQRRGARPFELIDARHS